MKSPEGYEKSEIDKYLKSRSIWFFSPQTGGFGGSGVPDRVGCYKGTFFSIEVKRPGKEPTPIQARRIAEIQLNGGIAVWGVAEKVIAELKVLLV
jgi:hypothetical protein